MKRLATVALVVAIPLAAATPAAAMESLTPNSATFAPTFLSRQSPPQTFTLRVRCQLDPADMTGNTCLGAPTPFSPVFTTSGDFAILSEDCPPTLPGNSAFGTSCEIQVAFAPWTAGQLTGILETGSAFARAALRGEGLAPVCPGSNGSSCGPVNPGPVRPNPRCKKPKKKAGAAAKKCKRKKKPKR